MLDRNWRGGKIAGLKPMKKRRDDFCLPRSEAARRLLGHLEKMPAWVRIAPTKRERLAFYLKRIADGHWPENGDGQRLAIRHTARLIGRLNNYQWYRMSVSDPILRGLRIWLQRGITKYGQAWFPSPYRLADKRYAGLKEEPHPDFEEENS